MTNYEVTGYAPGTGAKTTVPIEAETAQKAVVSAYDDHGLSFGVAVEAAAPVIEAASAETLAPSEPTTPALAEPAANDAPLTVGEPPAPEKKGK